MPPALEHSVRVQLRWRDIDMLGHLNQAVYHAEVRKDHGEVHIVMRVKRVGSSSVELEHEVKLPDGRVAASGTSVLVAWDLVARAKRPLSREERDALR